MDHDDVVRLLAAAAHYDPNREASPAIILAWGKAAELGGWTFEEALAAIHAYYVRETFPIMPGHITQAVELKREAAEPYPPRYDPHEHDHRPKANPEHIRKVIADLTRDMGWKERLDSEVDWRSVECPVKLCKAKPGQRCRTPLGQELRQSPCHPGREDLAKELRGELDL